MTYEAVEAVVHATVIRWEEFGGNIELMLMRDLAPTIAALATVTTERDQARASSVLWGAIVANVERAIDAHAFDDEDGNGFMPIGPLQDALSGKAGL